MGWPQYTYVGLCILGIGATMAKHGEPRSPFHLGNTLINTAIGLGLLWAGGFFGGCQ